MLNHISATYNFIVHLNHIYNLQTYIPQFTTAINSYIYQPCVYRINEEIWEIVDVENDLFNCPEVL